MTLESQEDACGLAVVVFRTDPAGTKSSSPLPSSTLYHSQCSPLHLPLQCQTKGQ